MYTTYHLSSAQEVSSDILDAIKATFKSKSITIIVRENTVRDEADQELSLQLKAILDERENEDESSYLSMEELFGTLRQKYKTP
jgi:hypothetical protein